MARLKAGIVGTGLIARHKHIPAMLRSGRDVELTAICDVNVEAARQLASEKSIPAVYGSVGELLAREKLDIVDICTPPQTHAAIAVQAMESGCNVLIEKPMAPAIEDCDRIVEVSRRLNRKVFVAHTNLFYYPFMEAQRRFRRGDIGEFRGMRIFLSTPVDYITSKKDHWAHRLPGGILGETGPHIVYMTLAFLGKVERVSVNAIKIEPRYPWSAYEDFRLDLIGPSGISSVTLSYATQQWGSRLEIIGTEGFLLLDLEAMSCVRYRRRSLTPGCLGRSFVSEAAQMFMEVSWNSLRYGLRRWQSTHDIIVREFARSIRTDSPPPVTAEDGRETVRVLSMLVDALARTKDPAQVSS